jgi:hypothetical protein
MVLRISMSSVPWSMSTLVMSQRPLNEVPAGEKSGRSLAGFPSDVKVSRGAPHLSLVKQLD